MKKFLLLSFVFSVVFQINGQQLSDLESLHEKLAQESEQYKKDKTATIRDVYKRDSTYFYDDFEDNLEVKWIYFDYNFANNYASYEAFDYVDMQWIPTFDRNREFNSDGSVSSYITQKHDNGGLINFSKTIFEYNDDGYQTLDYRENWDVDLQEWIPLRRFERTYNADNTLLTVTYSSRDLTTNNLELRYVITYTNIDNVITEWLWEDYNDGVLYNTEKTEVYLNAENDRDSTYTYEWNEDDLTWDLISRYIYPEDINASVRTYQTDLFQEATNSWDPQLLSVYSDYTDISETQYLDRFRSDEGESEFYLNNRFEYFWSSNPLVDVEVPTGNEIDIIIPNPFAGNPQITVNGIKENTTFAIYNIYGKRMFTKDLNQSNSFILDKVLPNGSYIINLIQENDIVETKKVVKVR